MKPVIYDDVEFDYWCPTEGWHVDDPTELHVGVVRNFDDGTSEPLLVLAIVPPLPGYGQAEVVAQAVKESVACIPWNDEDGIAEMMVAHGADPTQCQFPERRDSEQETEK